MTISSVSPTELCETYKKMYHAMISGATTGVTGTPEELHELRQKIETLVPQFDLDPFYSPDMYPAAKPAVTLPRRRERVSLLSQRRVDALSHESKESTFRVRKAALEDDPIALHDKYIKMYHANVHGANTGVTGTSTDLRNLKCQISELAPRIEWEWEPTYDPARYPPSAVKEQESALKTYTRTQLESLGIDLSKKPVLPEAASYRGRIKLFFRRYSSKKCTPDIVLYKTADDQYYCRCTLSCYGVEVSFHQSSQFSLSLKNPASAGKIEETVSKAYQNAYDYITRLLNLARLFNLTSSEDTIK